MADVASAMLPLALERVSFVAGGRTVLDDVDLVIDRGLRTVVIGPNGAGKSVLLRVCHGLLSPTSGRVRWNGIEDRGQPRRQAMVFQRPVTFRRTVIGNLMLPLSIAGVPRAERESIAHAALARVGLADFAHRPARVLSGGEQQRLALARASMLRPEVLFLDEPTANLDPSATREIEAIVQSIHEAGTKIVLVTHNFGQAQRLGDEVLFIDRGRIAERASVDRFFKNPASAEADAFLKGELPWH